MLDEGKPLKARAALAATLADLETLLAADHLPSGVRPLAAACATLKEDLELEGVDMSAIAIPKVSAARSKTSAKATMPQAKESMPQATQPPKPRRPVLQPSAAGQTTSFSRQIAPMLSRHCGGCHVTGRKGDFQMASYEGLMRTGVVARGQGASSRIVEVIESGDMPRGGGRVAPEELAVLVRWIDSGAPFDGPDPTVGIDMLARAPAPAVAVRPVATTPATRPAVQPASEPVVLGPGEVSFAFEIAPMLVKNCGGCHDADDPEARLSMATFASLNRGGESGAPFVAGSAGDSLIIRKVKGSAGIDGQRMPIGKPPLPAEAIGLLEKWIDQGARLDMLQPADSLATIAAAGRSRSLGHEELMAIRLAAGEKLWKRTLDGEPHAVVRRGDIAVIGNLPQSRLDAIAEAAERVCETTGGQIVGKGKPIAKGGLVLFVFNKPYDFSNFWQAVVGDERPQTSVGLSGVVGDVVYGAIVPPAASEDGSEAELQALLTEQIGAAAYLSRAAPAWFARGAGRALAARAVPKAASVGRWRLETAASLPRLESADGLLSDASPPAVSSALGAGFLGGIGSPAKLAAVAAALDAGESFDRAFGSVFHAEPKNALEAWLAGESRGGSRRR